jgi:hypothetical protein
MKKRLVMKRGQIGPDNDTMNTRMIGNPAPKLNPHLD